VFRDGKYVDAQNHARTYIEFDVADNGMVVTHDSISFSPAAELVAPEDSVIGPEVMTASLPASTE
jgi:hypothetical protein